MTKTSSIVRRSIAASTLFALPVVLAVSAAAQTQSPASPQKSAPSEMSAAPAKTAAGVESKAAISNVTIGTAVFTSDGQKIGEVRSVKSDSSGMVEEIHVKSGANLIVVPGAKISKGGQTVQLALTSAEAGKLPVITGKSG